VIWTGVFLASAHVLNSVSPLYPSWFGYTMLISPLFTTFILTKVLCVVGYANEISGIPPLERLMNKRFRGRKDYEEYKRNTPILIPKL
jgi:steroid 5-alpha reductase family enzyme